MREALIFRHNLFKPSEPFIAQQGQALRRYRPLYLGRLRYGPAPIGAESLTIADAARWPLMAAGRQMLLAKPDSYLRLLGDRRPALIHAHFGVEGHSALALAARLGIPLITTFHGFDATLSFAGLLANPAWQRYALGRRQLAEQGQLFLCASEFLREKILALGFPPDRCRTHYIGVDIAAISPRATEEEANVILHVARLEPVKGTSVLLDAFARIAPSYPAVRLLIIGDGQLRGRLQAQARDASIGDQVEFLGALPHAQVLERMRRAAILSVPSIRTKSGREEGLGLATLEAAATGVPAIGSRIGGIPEAVDDGQTGFLVPEQDPAALADKLRTLLDDPALRWRFGAAARLKVAAQFDLAKQTAKLESFYDSQIEPAS